MALGELGWLIALSGLPFAFILSAEVFQLHLDIWHAQAAWMQGWVILLWAGALAKGLTLSVNRSLAAFIGWVGLSAWWSNTVLAATANHYALGLLMPLWHLMILVLAIQAAVAWWTPRLLERLCTVLAWTGVIVLVYAGLQLLNCDEFLRALDSDHPDELVGPIGNPSHFAAYLSFFLPLWLYRKRPWPLVAGIATALLFKLGSSIALLTAWVIWMAWLWRTELYCSHKKWVRPAVIGLLTLCGGVIAWHLRSGFFDFNGRQHAWLSIWTLIHQGKAITGFGPGFLLEYSNSLPETNPMHTWRHAHNSYLQAWLEYGFIGLCLLGWMVQETVQRWRLASPSTLRTILGWVGVAFLLNCTVNWPTHLWALGSFGLLAYAGMIVLTEDA